MKELLANGTWKIQGKCGLFRLLLVYPNEVVTSIEEAILPLGKSMSISTKYWAGKYVLIDRVISNCLM